MSSDWIGWAASAILIATLARQIVQQGMATLGAYLVGCSSASTRHLGFVIYSVLVDNWVFIVTNRCVLLTAVIGQVRIMLGRRLSHVRRQSTARHKAVVAPESLPDQRPSAGVFAVTDGACSGA